MEIWLCDSDVKMLISILWIMLVLLGISQVVKGSSDIEHCSITTRYDNYPSQRKIIPESSNASKCDDIDSNVSRLDISLCPDSRYIKFSIKLNQTHEMNVSLCYTIQSVMDWRALVTHCYKIRLPSVASFGQLDCWFPFEYAELRPTILATLNYIKGDKCQSAYGEIATGTLDMENSCINTCDHPVTKVQNLVTCDGTVTVSRDPRTVLLYATFTSKNDSECKDVAMETRKQTGSETQYFIKCDYVGPGYILITFTRNDVYCQRKHNVYILCDTASITVLSSRDSNSTTENVWRQHQLAIYLTITIFSLTVITTLITFVFVRNRRKRRSRYPTRRAHGRSESCDTEQQAQPLVDFV